MIPDQEHSLKLEPPEGFNIDDYFVFENNIVYQVADLPKNLGVFEFAGIRNKVFEKHLDYCDKDIRESWYNESHLSLNWENGGKTGPITVELFEILKPLGYVEEVGVGYYHGNTIVLFPVFSEDAQDFNMKDLQGKKLPWFYKGFSLR